MASFRAAPGPFRQPSAHGHDAQTWKNIATALRMVGYDYVISIEHEDPLMSQDEGLAKGVAALKDAVMVESPGAMTWA